MIVLIPINHVERETLDRLVRPASEIFRQPVEIGSCWEVPAKSRDFKRAQYQADLILDDIQDPQPGNRHLGIFNMDIYAFGLNFIFGEADTRTKKALISLYRLKPEYYGLPRNDALFHERTLKEAVHEIGHTYGLRHCPNIRCIMHFSNSIEDTDIKGPQFCPLCQKSLSHRL